MIFAERIMQRIDAEWPARWCGTGLPELKCERGLTRLRMRPARRVHRVLLNRACDGGERIIGVAADQTNRADNEYQDYSQHHRIFRDVLALFVLPKLKGEVKHYTPFLAGVFSVWRESGCKD